MQIDDGIREQNDYGLNRVPPANLYIEDLTPGTSEWGYIWRQGL